MWVWMMHDGLIFLTWFLSSIKFEHEKIWVINLWLDSSRFNRKFGWQPMTNIRSVWAVQALKMNLIVTQNWSFGWQAYATILSTFYPDFRCFRCPQHNWTQMHFWGLMSGNSIVHTKYEWFFWSSLIMIDAAWCHFILWILSVCFHSIIAAF